MEDSNLSPVVRQLIRELSRESGISESTFLADPRFLRVHDSMEFIELVMEIEEEFGPDA